MRPHPRQLAEPNGLCNLDDAMINNDAYKIQIYKTINSWPFFGHLTVDKCASLTVLSLPIAQHLSEHNKMIMSSEGFMPTKKNAARNIKKLLVHVLEMLYHNSL